VQIYIVLLPRRLFDGGGLVKFIREFEGQRRKKEKAAKGTRAFSVKRPSYHLALRPRETRRKCVRKTYTPPLVFILSPNLDGWNTFSFSCSSRQMD
jgi:hypothetical protein